MKPTFAQKQRIRLRMPRKPKPATAYITIEPSDESGSLMWATDSPEKEKKVIAAVRRILGKPEPMLIWRNSSQFG